jgi:hypothetical protein
MKTRVITLPKGGTLEVTMSPKFLKAVRDHFQVEDWRHLDDDHIRMFIHGSVDSAIAKAERELTS